MSAHIPEDQFATYFFHKLKAWIPENYWTDDFRDGSLEALIRTIADAAATARRDVDRVWTASSIELADDWAVGYLGDLVGATPLSAQNARANRTTVANMMSYNRRKTTRYLLDQLIGDVFGTEGYVREIERWLLRPPHALEMGYGRTAPLTQGPVAGLPNFTAPRADDAALDPFDEFARLPDVGPRRGRLASFDYATIHLNVFAMESYRLDMAAPFWLDDTHLTLDPSGRDIPIFHSSTFDHTLGAWPVGPEEFPVPMRCARFNDAQFEVSEAGLQAINSPPLTTALTPWIGQRFDSMPSFRRVVRDRLTAADFSLFWVEILTQMMVSDSAKPRQIKDDLLLDVGPFADTRSLTDAELVAANLDSWFPAADWPEQAGLLVDVGNGRVQFETALDPVGPPAQVFHPRYHHIGMIHRVGAGPYPRGGDISIGPAVTDANVEAVQNIPASGEVTFRDNRRYAWQWNAITRRHDISGDLALVAADQTRPYLVSRAPDGSLTFTINGTDTQDNTLEIDGLWLGAMADTAITHGLVNPDDPFPFAHAQLVIDGRFENVTLRHMTLDPGGEQARLDPLTARAIPAVTLAIEGSIKSLRIDKCILGPIAETRTDPSLLNAGVIRICDSIITSIDPDVPAVATELSRLYLDNTTIMGAVHANLIFATNTIFDGPLYVTNRQNSCLRFSAVGTYEGTGADPSALPRRFECHTFAGSLPATTFRSTRFGDPDFATLSHIADKAFFTGGEHRTEMGVGHARFWNQRRADLARFVAKFLPVGQEIQIYEEIGGSQ